MARLKKKSIMNFPVLEKHICINNGYVFASTNHILRICLSETTNFFTITEKH